MGSLLALTSVTTKTSARHLAEIASIIGVVGAIVLIVGGGFGLGLLPGGGDSTGRLERIGYVVGALLIGIAFLLMLVAIHGGFGSVTVK